jgi:DNA polymerase eta
MPFQKIRNLGGKLGNAVKETYEAETVEDLQKFTLVELQDKLGDDSGVWLWEVCRGLDFTEGEANPLRVSCFDKSSSILYIAI